MRLRDTLALNLQREMTARRLSQSELARRCGAAPARINEILHGKYAATLDTIERLSAALGVPPGVLLMPIEAPASAAS